MRPLVFCALLFTAGPALAAPVPAKGNSTNDAAELAERLMDRHDFDRVQDTPLKAVLDSFQERTGVTVLLDYKALLASRGTGMAELDGVAINRHSLKNVRGETALRQIADQIEAVIFYTPDHVLLTSPQVMAELVGPVRPLPALSCAGIEPASDAGENFTRPTAYVTASFRDLPLADALRAMSVRANRTVVISVDAAEKAKTAVSASLANVPFESAVSTLAEAAGLRAVRNGNAILVVTEARAKELTESERRLMVGVGGGGLGGGGTYLTLEDLQAIAKLFPGKVDPEAIQKEVNRLRAEKKEGK